MPHRRKPKQSQMIEKSATPVHAPPGLSLEVQPVANHRDVLPDIVDLARRVQRLELLLFRLSDVDFAALDKEIMNILHASEQDGSVIGNIACSTGCQKFDMSDCCHDGCVHTDLSEACFQESDFTLEDAFLHGITMDVQEVIEMVDEPNVVPACDRAARELRCSISAEHMGLDGPDARFKFLSIEQSGSQQGGQDFQRDVSDESCRLKCDGYYVPNEIVAIGRDRSFHMAQPSTRAIQACDTCVGDNLFVGSAEADLVPVVSSASINRNDKYNKLAKSNPVLDMASIETAFKKFGLDTLSERLDNRSRGFKLSR